MILRKFLTGVIILLSAAAVAQMPVEQQQAIVLKRMIERNHYSPRAVNDAFSDVVFNKMISRLDPLHLLFTSADVEQLSVYRYQIDDELQGSGWKFLSTLNRIYSMAVNRADSIVNLVLQQPLDVNTPDKITISTQTIENYVANVTALKNAWIRHFKFRLLNQAYDLSLSQLPKQSLENAIAKNESVLRQKMQRRNRERFEQFKDPQSMQDFLMETFLTSVAQAFDPHTMYFSPEQNEQFKTALSTQEETYGFVVAEHDGKTMIMHLVPGGPAWRSGEVHRNDQLLQLQFDKKDPVDVSLMETEEVEALLHQSSASTVTIRIKKGDGIIKSVTLKREKADTEENRVKGYVLQGLKKIGYISLPDFYTSWEGGAGSSCAEDVAKEIVHLKKEGIEGLIVDVRYNGGGSLQEAVEMIGIFINDGPVFAAKDRTKPVYLKDPNRGTIWDGPLAILINGQSASASESLAGSLQDYNRAVVVGSASFGKATMQQIFPMDTMAGTRMVKSRFGFVKITTGQLYRLNGSTAQLKGVQPDIGLPDAFSVVQSGEEHLPNSLPADSISRNNYYKPMAPLPLKELAAASKNRVTASSAFAEIYTGIQDIAAMYKMKSQEIPLQKNLFEKWRAENEGFMNVGGKARAQPHAGFTVVNHQFGNIRLQDNSYAGEINRRLSAQLQQDIYIEETYHIVSDLIQLNKL